MLFSVFLSVHHLDTVRPALNRKKILPALLIKAALLFQWSFALLPDLLLSKYLPEEAFSEEQEYMEEYWKTFFETIAIEARKNPRHQQQMLPKYYRKYFSKSGDKCFE